MDRGETPHDRSGSAVPIEAIADQSPRKAIPPLAIVLIPEALDRLIELYTATNKPDETTNWRAERAKYPTPKEVAPSPRQKK